jgi:predicted PurR-regulated permease PerM
MDQRPDETQDGGSQPVERRRPPPAHGERVPVRTIAVTIGMVLATGAILLLAWQVRRVLTWIAVATLLAVVLGPLVDLAERRLHLRRALATLLVFFVVVLAFVGIFTAFIRPLVKEGSQVAERAPAYVNQARSGRGPVGALIRRYKLDQYVERNQARLRDLGSRITTPALTVLRSIVSTVVGLVTIFVLTYLIVLQGPKLAGAWVDVLPDQRRQRVRRVAAESSRAVVGYMTGNLLISVIAAALTYVVFWILGVPYRGVVALFVGFADLIPLVGATLGAVVAIIVALLHSLIAAIVVLVFFILYQQFENHVLQPVIMSRTVQLSALTVLVSVLLGVELLGLLGALLAIPVAGIVHVIGRELYESYRGRRKPEPTNGDEEIPASRPRAPTDPAEAEDRTEPGPVSDAGPP